jgi:phosphoglycolate phosphatase-like HAD superfamily hydrolase
MHLVKLNPTYHETISYLEKRNIGWSIITSKPKKNTLALLDFLNINCPFVICPDDVKKGKPYPDSIEKLRRDAKIKSGRLIYVGDMLSDLQFAINSKIKYVHYTNGIEKKFNKNLVSDCVFINDLFKITEIIDAI